MSLNLKISNWLFYAFILFLPWQTRLILFPGKSEFLGFSIYLSEIFLWLAFGFWLIRDYRKIKIKGFFLYFYIFTLVSLVWAVDRVAGIRISLYLFESLLIFYYIASHREYLKKYILTFLISMLVASGFAIYQFMELGSGAFKWLGLASRGAWNLGDIVLDTGVGRFLRAYGPLPHPNIFGGYLAVAILLILQLLKNMKRKNNFCPTLYVLAGIFTLALFLTFSRSAWLALLFAVAYFVFKNLNNKAIKKFALYLVTLVIVLGFIFFPLIKSRTSGSFIEARSTNQRIETLKQGVEVWQSAPLLGVGAGNYMSKLQTTSYKLQTNEPPHNIFLLILAELGVLGFMLYLMLWKKLYKKSAPAFLILFFVIGLFDHYLWTLYPGAMLFWFGVGLSQK